MIHRLYQLGRHTWSRYDRDHGDVLGAGLAFYALLSAAPLAWLMVTVASGVLEREDARSALIDAVRSIAGADVANETSALLLATRELVGGSATWVAAVLLLWAASRLFVQIQVVLNLIWGVRLKASRSTLMRLRHLAAKRALSFVMVIVCGILLVGAVLIHALGSAMLGYLDRWLDAVGVALPALVVPDLAISFLLVMLALAAIYRTLPDARIPWADVWVGAAVTGSSIAGGTVLLSWFLARSASSVVNGALGSMAAFVLWEYYMCQVFVLGAAFTREWADSTRGEVTPESHAELDSRA